MTIIEIVDDCGNFVTAIPESAHTNINAMAYVDFNPNIFAHAVAKFTSVNWSRLDDNIVAVYTLFQSEDGISWY